MARRTRTPKAVENITHEYAKRRNLPSVEHEPLMRDEERNSIRVAYERPNSDLEPQLTWQSKDEQGRSGLVVNAPPLYIQERVHPKALVKDLMQETARRRNAKAAGMQSDFADLFADFNGLPSEDAKTEFYQHNANWSNRMVLGDNIQVMASLAEREGLRGKVQCIYIDPPDGIRFNSNFQWSATSRKPEQVKPFHDNWRDGIHSYLTYLRDRLTVARDLLAESGSIFVQIGDENVHRVRILLDEVFGKENLISEIVALKPHGISGSPISNVSDFVLWYGKNRELAKTRPLFLDEPYEFGTGDATWLMNPDFTHRSVSSAEKVGRTQIPEGSKLYNPRSLISPGRASTGQPFTCRGVSQDPYQSNSHWRVDYPAGLNRLLKAERIHFAGNNFRFRRYHSDFGVHRLSNIWTDRGTRNFTYHKTYMVQTGTKTVERCILMATDPGDLVLDPTCGSGTTAYVAEQWGRRWITIDTSRVALATARARIMGARYPYHLLLDSREGQLKEAEIAGIGPSGRATFGNVRRGFVYERVPRITLSDIANNAEIDVIWKEYDDQLTPLRERLSAATGQSETLEEWEIPRDLPDEWPADAQPLHAEFWETRIARQKAIDASIARNAEVEYLYDKLYEDRYKTRVAGPFTVESISPHQMLDVDENDEIFNRAREWKNGYDGNNDYVKIILEDLKTSGVQQAHMEEKIEFDSLNPWPGRLICAEGSFVQYGDEFGVRMRAGIFIGPKGGTVSRQDLVEAAQEATNARFNVLIACAFSYDAHTIDFTRLGRLHVVKAQMNADRQMEADQENTSKSNLFFIFGEPDIDILDADDGQIQVRVNGVDVFHPNSGEVRSDGPDGIACWFIDTDYNEEAFFVRHAYLLAASDPYRSLKTALMAGVDAEAWESIHSNISRPFSKPESGKIAVKVINELSDEALKVYKVS